MGRLQRVMSRDQFWYDFEKDFFDLLRIYFERKECELMKRLNQDLEEIGFLLKDYLNNISHTPSNKMNTFLNTIYLENKRKERNIMLVNFNYTFIADSYFEGNEKVLKYHIHGDLKNDIIIGYGNDTDQYYKEIKMSEEPEYLRKFKTTSYLKNKTYQKIINQIESLDSYDIIVLGHSIGATDRTFFKEIAERDECKAIHIAKRDDLYQCDDQTECIKDHETLQINLLRCFDKDSDARKKIQPTEDGIVLPMEDVLLKEITPSNQ